MLVIGIEVTLASGLPDHQETWLKSNNIAKTYFVHKYFVTTVTKQNALTLEFHVLRKTKVIIQPKHKLLGTSTPTGSKLPSARTRPAVSDIWVRRASTWRPWTGTRDVWKSGKKMRSSEKLKPVNPNERHILNTILHKSTKSECVNVIIGLRYTEYNTFQIEWKSRGKSLIVTWQQQR